jgi:hypothetical protein
MKFTFPLHGHWHSPCHTRHRLIIAEAWGREYTLALPHPDAGESVTVRVHSRLQQAGLLRSNLCLHVGEPNCLGLRGAGASPLRPQVTRCDQTIAQAACGRARLLLPVARLNSLEPASGCPSACFSLLLAEWEGIEGACVAIYSLGLIQSPPGTVTK